MIVVTDRLFKGTLQWGGRTTSIDSSRFVEDDHGECIYIELFLASENDRIHCVGEIARFFTRQDDPFFSIGTYKGEGGAWKPHHHHRIEVDLTFELYIVPGI